MKNIKKIILLLPLISSLSVLAIVLEPNTITNNTGINVTVDTIRHLKCLGNPLQTITESTTLGAGQKGNIYVKGGARLGCMSNVAELKAEAPGYTSAVVQNPEAKDYKVSIKLVTPLSGFEIPDQSFQPMRNALGQVRIPPAAPVSVSKKLVIEAE